MRMIKPLIGLAAIVLFASSANAATIAFSVVEAEDLLITPVNLSNSGNAEQTYLEGLFGPDIVYTKIDQADGQSGSWLEVTGDPLGTDLWAFNLSPYVSDAGYFLVKLGNATFSHYLYQNVASLAYAVIDLSDITASNGNITIESVSHISTVGGGTRVPEPASLSLVALGLIAVGAARRSRRGTATTA